MTGELIFIPMPSLSHIASTMEIAKLLVHRDDRLSITVLLISSQYTTSITTYINSLIASSDYDRIRFIHLPELDSEEEPKRPFMSVIDDNKPIVKEAVTNLALSFDPSHRLAGFVIDMFCVGMIEVADELGLPSYPFFTSSTSFLALQFHVQTLADEEEVDITEFKNSDVMLPIPGLVNPLPAKTILPSAMLNKDWLPYVLNGARGFRKTKGIMVNSFAEIESNAVTSLSNSTVPPVYTVGPIINFKGDGQDSDTCTAHKYSNIMTWLDDQPPSSVLFLCFGSLGSFDEEQVKEIARALEGSGHRFLWSLRRPPPKDKTMSFPTEYENFEEVLPEGFVDRTVGMGKVMGWAPQVAVLAHPSIGGFVTHCGWNSILESVWFGVPMAAWPLYAEQQFNAFHMVVELGLAVEIKMDYRKDYAILGLQEERVSAEVIEKGIRCLMEEDNDARKKVKEMSEISRKALMDGGSSHAVLGQFIEDVMNNISA
ncbi:anthocyanidin 3-O-glucosyltransferase 2-like [Carica papaya]|uniref:anthocyanidin 3-O-glucosyltransferase 2-like n=1 Tax=Carica papaya TaxID=3649 RepID=UPI000B8D1218|nr:anthocyanidin 3-O-glucosyltransferase 2-like [Carica papaya]